MWIVIIRLITNQKLLVEIDREHDEKQYLLKISTFLE